MNTINAFCERPWNRIKVTSEGEVSSCCWQYYNTLGNILKQPFDEIWQGSVANQIREKTAQGEFHTLCKVCNCPYLFKDLKKEMHDFEYDEYPTRIEIDMPNTHCNIGAAVPTKDNPACIMCPRSSTKFKPQKDMLNKVLKRLRFLMPYLEHMHVQGIAEPFFKERFFEVIDILDFAKYNTKCRISVITNGTLFAKKIRDKYAELCPWSDTLFSVDAATSKTYKKVRIIDAFDFVKNNIKEFCSERKADKQGVTITNNINMFNVGEVVQMVELAHWCGVDTVEFNATDPVHGPIDPFVVNKERAPIFKKAQEDAIQRAKELGVKIQFVKNLNLTYEVPDLVQIT